MLMAPLPKLSLMLKSHVLSTGLTVTSGILMVATTLAASRELARAFQSHDHDKTYLALVLGVPRPYQGLIDAPLAKRGGKRDGGGLEKMAIDHEQGSMPARSIA